MSISRPDGQIVFPKQNPVLIPEVLENILNKTEWSFEDLKIMRSVCKFWHGYTLPRWRSRATVCLIQDRRPSSSSAKGIPAKEFAEIVCDGNHPLQLNTVPFSKYKLVNWNIDGRYNNFRLTWASFGSLIHKLTLEKCIFKVEVTKFFNFIVHTGSPQLKHLVLDSCDNESDWVSHSIRKNRNIEHLEVTKWMPFKQPEADDNQYDNFLKSFPRLKTLKMTEMAEEILPQFLVNSRERDEALRDNVFLGGRLNPKHLPLLRELDIMHWNLSPCSYGDIVWTVWTFRRLQFPLHSLSISMNSYKRLRNEFNMILSAHRETLRILKVFVPTFHVPQKYNLGGPQDLLIEELELWGNVLQDFSFLLDMPNLKKLKMDYGCFEKWKFMEKSYSEKARYPVSCEDIMRHTFQLRNRQPTTEFVVMEHLTEFHIDLYLGVGEIKLIGKWMPNLRTFKSVFDSENIRILLRHWKNTMKLRELHALYGSTIGDFEICGVPGNMQYPNISWLKELKHFSSQAYCNKGLFTDASVEEGFLKTKLCSLRISVSPEFSDEMEKRLMESIPLVEVIRNYGGHISECCRMELFRKKALVPRNEGVDKSSYFFLKREQLIETGSIE